jgi:hypothetical protein
MCQISKKRWFRPPVSQEERREIHQDIPAQPQHASKVATDAVQWSGSKEQETAEATAPQQGAGSFAPKGLELGKEEDIVP